MDREGWKIICTWWGFLFSMLNWLKIGGCTHRFHLSFDQNFTRCSRGPGAFSWQCTNKWPTPAGRWSQRWNPNGLTLTQQLFLTPKLGEEKLGEDTAHHEDSNSCSCSEKNVNYKSQTLPNTFCISIFSKSQRGPRSMLGVTRFLFLTKELQLQAKSILNDRKYTPILYPNLHGTTQIDATPLGSSTQPSWLKTPKSIPLNGLYKTTNRYKLKNRRKHGEFLNMDLCWCFAGFS